MPKAARGATSATTRSRLARAGNVCLPSRSDFPLRVDGTTHAAGTMFLGRFRYGRRRLFDVVMHRRVRLVHSPSTDRTFPSVCCPFITAKRAGVVYPVFGCSLVLGD